MSDDETAPARENNSNRTTNLARIRDNQRRSRARRKEYLQELEAKYRSCEQLGVEASSDIQAAARKVIEENRRLRALLLRRGWTEAEIEEADVGVGVTGLEDGVGAVAGGGAGAGASGGDEGGSSGAVSLLEGLLESRRVCRPGEGGSGGCGPRSDASGEGERKVSLASASSTTATAMRPQQQQQRGQNLPSLRPQLQPIAVAPSARNVSPYSTSSASARLEPDRNGFANVYGAAPTPTSIYHPQQQQQQNHHQPQQSQQHRQSVGYSMPYDTNGNSFTWIQQYENTPNLQQDPEAAYAETMAESSSSCYAAADAIRSMNPALGYELEMELGCGTGQECAVPNSRIFSLMDRYSGGSA